MLGSALILTEDGIDVTASLFLNFVNRGVLGTFI